MIYDAIIFGGGVVGCSILNKLVRLGKNVVLVEKFSDVATGSSKANSGLVHASFDCEPNTLKAKMNVRGNALYDNLTKELSVPFSRTGAVVVGNDLEKLQTLKKRGEQNGVLGLEIIDSAKLHSLVKNLNQNINYALYAPSAGIVSPYGLTIALAEEAVINGGQIKFNFDTIKIENKNDYYAVSSKNETICGKYLINCASFGYNDIAKLIGAEEYPLTFKRGEYYVLDKCDFVNLSVFPLPTEKGKGILATPTISGNILLGPTSDISDYDTTTTRDGLINIKNEINERFNNVPFYKTINEFSGIRVSSGKDFIIEKSKKKQNVINICSIDSPGLSSAPAISEYICELLEFENKEKEIKRRVPYGKISSLSSEEANKKIKANSKYGHIICRCEVVSEGDILDAIHSPLKPTTFDAIKRRVRTGMGRCQGGYCTPKIIELLAKETGRSYEDIYKEHFGSNYIFGDIKNSIKEQK